LSNKKEISNFLANLDEICKSENITKKNLAEFLSVDPASFSRSLNAENGPKLGLIIKIANKLKVKPYELLLDEEDKKTNSIPKNFGKREALTSYPLKIFNI
jgi:transcriptional regulator with XRE-family HTH domain